MRELEVEHPAARLLLLAAQQQEAEMGDGTNFVVLLAGELLIGAEELVRMGIRPSLIVEGYEIAYKRALEIIDGEIPIIGTINDAHNTESLKPLVESVLGSKQSSYAKTLARLVLDAVKIANPRDGAFNPENVRCVKILGGSIPSSTVIAGMVLEREPLGHVHRVENAKIAVFACSINSSRTETKGTVLIRGAQDLLDFGKGEESILQDQIQSISDSGVKVIVTGDTIGELALHFIERCGMMALKIPSKFDLRRLCKAVGATPLARLGAPTEEEAGRCDIVETVEFGGQRCTVFRQTDSTHSRLATIVLRSNTMSLLDDIERSIEDSLFSIKAASKDGRFLPGAGASEIELSQRLIALADTTPGIAQYAIRKYAEAFEVVPRQLATNAGQDATEVIAKLIWSHNQGNTSVGVDADDDIVDLLAVKRCAIHLATEAALTVLRVDQIIMSKPAAGPKARSAAPQDSDD
jgi:T-complex protein 1 subunit theta